MKRQIFIIILSFVVLGIGAGVPAVQSQSYPAHSVQLIIPGTPGSIIDITGRLLADELSKSLKQQFVPINKPGGAFTVGTDFVARAKKDGYTLVYTNNPAIVYGRILTPEAVNYDPDKDLDPLGLHVFFAHSLAVQETSPWKTFNEFIDYAKKNPNKIRYSTPGIGSTSHFNMEIIQSLTGAQFTHVPFKSGEAVITALLGGHVEATFDAISSRPSAIASSGLSGVTVSVSRIDFRGNASRSMTL